MMLKLIVFFICFSFFTINSHGRSVQTITATAKAAENFSDFLLKTLKPESLDCLTHIAQLKGLTPQGSTAAQAAIALFASETELQIFETRIGLTFDRITGKATKNVSPAILSERVNLGLPLWSTDTLATLDSSPSAKARCLLTQSILKGKTTIKKPVKPLKAGVYQDIKNFSNTEMERITALWTKHIDPLENKLDTRLLTKQVKLLKEHSLRPEEWKERIAEIVKNINPAGIKDVQVEHTDTSPTNIQSSINNIVRGFNSFEYTTFKDMGIEISKLNKANPNIYVFTGSALSINTQAGNLRGNFFAVVDAKTSEASIFYFDQNAIWTTRSMN